MSAENIIATVRGAIHTGHMNHVNLARFVEREMRKLLEETIEECARECDPRPAVIYPPGAIETARNYAARIRSKKHPPTQPDAQTEQPMHMQNGLTLEQREWIRAEIACALESRPAAPTSKADEMLGRFIRWHDNDGPDDLDEILTAARAHVEAQGKASVQSSTGDAGSTEGRARSTRPTVAGESDTARSVPRRHTQGLAGVESGVASPTPAPPPTTGEREVPADDAGWPAWFPTFEELNTAARKAHMDRRIGVPSNVAIIDAVAGLIAQRSPLSPEAKGEGTVRDLVRKIDELRERALRERSNTALLDFRAATFDAWPTIRAALTGGAL